MPYTNFNIKPLPNFLNTRKYQARVSRGRLSYEGGRAALLHEVLVHCNCCTVDISGTQENILPASQRRFYDARLLSLRPVPVTGRGNWQAGEAVRLLLLIGTW